MNYEVKNFGKRIEERFSSLINDYGYRIIQKHKNSFILENQFVKISIYIEHTLLLLEIEDRKGSDVKFDIRLVYRTVTSKTIRSSFTIKDVEGSITTQLNEYCHLLETELKMVNTGDFSWVNNYLELETNLSRFIKVLGVSFTNHPAYKKFIKGDESWKSDLDVVETAR